MAVFTWKDVQPASSAGLFDAMARSNAQATKAKEGIFDAITQYSKDRQGIAKNQMMMDMLQAGEDPTAQQAIFDKYAQHSFAPESEDIFNLKKSALDNAIKQQQVNAYGIRALTDRKKLEHETSPEYLQMQRDKLQADILESKNRVKLANIDGKISAEEAAIRRAELDMQAQLFKSFGFGAPTSGSAPNSAASPSITNEGEVQQPTEGLADFPVMPDVNTGNTTLNSAIDMKRSNQINRAVSDNLFTEDSDITADNISTLNPNQQYDAFNAAVSRATRAAGKNASREEIVKETTRQFSSLDVNPANISSPEAAKTATHNQQLSNLEVTLNNYKNIKDPQQRISTYGNLDTAAIASKTELLPATINKAVEPFQQEYEFGQVLSHFRNDPDLANKRKDGTYILTQKGVDKFNAEMLRIENARPYWTRQTDFESRVKTELNVETSLLELKNEKNKIKANNIAKNKAKNDAANKLKEYQIEFTEWSTINKFADINPDKIKDIVSDIQNVDSWFTGKNAWILYQAIQLPGVVQVDNDLLSPDDIEASHAGWMDQDPRETRANIYQAALKLRNYYSTGANIVTETHGELISAPIVYITQQQKDANLDTSQKAMQKLMDTKEPTDKTPAAGPLWRRNRAIQ